MGSPQGREADKRARCHQRRPARGCSAPREAEGAGERGKDRVKANNNQEPRMDCASPNRLRQSARRRAPHGLCCRIFTQPAAVQQRAGRIFFFPLVSRKSCCRGGEFPPFPPSFFFFFSSHHPKATCLGGFARERHPASPSPPDAYLGLDFLLGQSHFSNPGAATSVPADIGRLRVHPIRLPLGYSTRLVLQSSLKIHYNRQVHKVFDGDS